MINTQTMIAEFTPMLAHKRNPEKLDVTKGAYLQPKLDGIRCFIRFDKDDVVRAYTRNNKIIHNVKHITDELGAFFMLYPDVILDGELYNHELKNDFNKIISLVRKTKPSDLDRIESADLIQFHAYDCFVAGRADWGYSTRLAFLNTIYSAFELSHIKPVISTFIMEEHIVKMLEEKYLKMGYEGAILRDDSPYKQGRSWGLQKLKRFDDEELIIIDYVQGRGKRSTGIGKFIARRDNGVLVGVPVMDTLEVLEEMWENRDSFIGKYATVKHFGETKAGSLRHPLLIAIRDYE